MTRPLNGRMDISKENSSGSIHWSYYPCFIKRDKMSDNKEIVSKSRKAEFIHTFIGLEAIGFS